jgi:hypothetical protein
MVVGINVSVKTSNPSSSDKRKVTQIVPIRVLKRREVLGWERNFVALR